jgi:hypothetical protein
MGSVPFAGHGGRLTLLSLPFAFAGGLLAALDLGQLGPFGVLALPLPSADFGSSTAGVTSRRMRPPRSCC